MNSHIHIIIATSLGNSRSCLIRTFKDKSLFENETSIRNFTTPFDFPFLRKQRKLSFTPFGEMERNRLKGHLEKFTQCAKISLVKRLPDTQICWVNVLLVLEDYFKLCADPMDMCRGEDPSSPPVAHAITEHFSPLDRALGATSVCQPMYSCEIRIAPSIR